MYTMLIQACENSLPQVLIVDELSTALEAQACASMAHRGIKLIATAHGSELSDLLRNPPLRLLVGDVKTVTLTDELAAQRGTSKTVQERELDCVFDVIVVIVDFNTIKVYKNLNKVIDAMLDKADVLPEERRIHAGKVLVTQIAKTPQPNTFSTIAERAHFLRTGVAPEKEKDNFYGKRRGK